MQFIIGVKIDELTKEQAIKKAEEFLLQNSWHKIFTPNPEMIVDAQTDKYFRDVLNSADMNLCDGIGIKMVSRGKIDKIAGSDFTVALCALAEKMNKSIYLLGSGNAAVVQTAANNLKTKFPKLNILGTHPGLTIKYSTFDAQMIEYDRQKNDALINQIIDLVPDILFVGFGHGKQEKWIAENLKHLPSVKIAMGVGGTFDFLAGKTKRAPQFIQNLGLEWLWRLILDPRRIKRIWKATITFLWLYANKKRCKTS